MPKKYALEIYHPGKVGYTVVCSMESDNVIMPINKGEFINPATLNIYCPDNLETDFRCMADGIILKVMGVEHSLIQKENGSISQHKITVYTEPTENDPARLYGQK